MVRASAGYHNLLRVLWTCQDLRRPQCCLGCGYVFFPIAVIDASSTDVSTHASTEPDIDTGSIDSGLDSGTDISVSSDDASDSGTQCRGAYFDTAHRLPLRPAHRVPRRPAL